MHFRVRYGPKTWDFVDLETDVSGIDKVDDFCDQPIALASFILRECLEDAEGRIDVKMEDIFVEGIHGDRGVHGDMLEIPFQSDDSFEGLITLCAKLVQLHGLIEANIHGVDMLLACIKNEGWDGFDFDNRHWSDRFSYTFDEDDYASFGKEYAQNNEVITDDDLAEYVDWDSYGKSKVDEYSEETFNGYTYLFDKGW